MSPSGRKGPERRLARDTFVLATVLLPTATLGVRGLGFARCHHLVSWLGRRLPRRYAFAAARDRADAVVDGVRRAAGKTALLPVDCLPRALVLYFLLRRAGIGAEFRLGARTLTGRFEAHAWVEVDGSPVGEEEAPNRVYAAFDLDGPGARQGSP